MAIKTFTTGEVLTASDTNTYLANAGLVYIKEVALTGTAVNITSCFSATYDSYQIVISNLSNTVGAVFLQYQLLSGTTPAAGANYTNSRLIFAPPAVSSAQSVNQTVGNFIPMDTGKNSSIAIISQPFLTVFTTSYGQGNYGSGANNAFPESFGSIHQVSTSYDGIRLFPAANSFSTGKAIVYGFRQA